MGERVPRYVQIAEALRTRARAAGNGVGVRFPSEPELAREFAVSRETLREALGVLRRDGLVYSVVGRGTFVSPGYREHGVRITQPINEPYLSGRPSLMNVMRQEYLAAPPEIRRALGLRTGRRVFCYTILRTIAGRPFRFGRVYLPETVASRLDLARAPSLTVSERIEQEAGIRLVRAHQFVVARAAPPEAARRLAVRRGAPVLLFRRTYYAQDGQVAEYVVEYQSCARFPYEETLVRARH